MVSDFSKMLQFTEKTFKLLRCRDNIFIIISKPQMYVLSIGTAIEKVSQSLFMYDISSSIHLYFVQPSNQIHSIRHRAH